MNGAFGSAALALHAHGLTVIPTGGEDGKSPLVKGWSRWKGQARSTVETFATKYPDANIGIVTGSISGVTVVDCDDENALANAVSRFGHSPLVTRSPRGGGHLYFRSTGERNANLRGHGLNVDIRGIGGMVLAPPSERKGVGSYRVERGGWQSLSALPALNPDALPPENPRWLDRASRPRAGAAEGGRNTALFAALRVVAHACGGLADLAAEAHGINAQFSPPLAAGEVQKVARSVWTLKEQGRLFVSGQEPRILMLPSELQTLSADAFYLWGWIKSWHGAKHGEPFALSPKAMQKAQTIKGWGRLRYSMTISELVSSGFLGLVHKGGRRKGDASLYRMGLVTGPNITRHPPPRLPHPGQGPERTA